MTGPRTTRVAIDWRYLAVAAVAIAVRLPHLSDRSIWFDEASSWQTASYGWNDLLHSVRLNVHLPLYYLLLKGWMAVFGESAASIRSFSVTFGVATVLLMGQFARELFRASTACRPADDGGEPAAARSFGLVVALLVALSPVQVFASIEARMYTMGTAFAALSAWLLLRILRTGGGTWAWTAYGLSVLGLLNSHHYGLFSFGAQAAFLGLYLIWLAGVGRGDEARRLLIPAAIVGLLVAMADLPTLGILRTQVGRVQQDYWIRPLTWHSFVSTFGYFIMPNPADLPRPEARLILGLVAAVAAVLAIGGRRGEGFVVASALLPMAFSAAVSTITPVWAPRYFRFAHLFVLAAVALAIWRLTMRRPALRSCLCASLAAGLLYANVAFWRGLDLAHNTGMRAAVATILGRIRPGESIVSTELLQYLTAKFYAEGRAPIHLVEPPPGMFWGWHVIRPADLISLDQLRDEMTRGIWLISTIPKLVVSPEWDLDDARLMEEYEFHYYMGLHKNIFVHHYAGPVDRHADGVTGRVGG
jgi:mannosyltransferase